MDLQGLASDSFKTTAGDGCLRCPLSVLRKGMPSKAAISRARMRPTQRFVDGAGMQRCAVRDS